MTVEQPQPKPKRVGLDGSDDHLFNERTGQNYHRTRPLKDVFDDLDTWRDVMTRINFDNDITDEEFSALRYIHERLNEDLGATHLP